jgi:hypothetical protein
MPEPGQLSDAVDTTPACPPCFTPGAPVPDGRTVCQARHPNTIESINARFRRSVSARGHFPAEQAALKHPYLVITSLGPTG